MVGLGKNIKKGCTGWVGESPRVEKEPGEKLSFVEIIERVSK